MCTQTPSLLRLPRPPLPPPLGHPGAGAELLLLSSSPPAPCFTRGRVLTAVPLFQFVPLSPSPPPNPCCVSIISDILFHSVPFVISSPTETPCPPQLGREQESAACCKSQRVNTCRVAGQMLSIRGSAVCCGLAKAAVDDE